jgi:predicted dithiol-disulfide oxidoreductase (DUF899 family)
MTTGIHFPNESREYRTARDELLAAEAELRGAVERVAAKRRALPVGGLVSTDYVFDELADGQPRKVNLSELFSKGKETLFLYSFMYGPKADQPCALCTSFLDALDAQIQHLTQRIDVAVVAKSPIRRIVDFARGRGWNRLRLVSAHGTTYQAEYFGEDAKENQWPMANVFVRRSDGVHHFWGSELLYAKSEGDTRHIDLLWPLWNVLDLTPEGRGADFYPQVSYTD